LKLLRFPSGFSPDLWLRGVKTMVSEIKQSGMSRYAPGDVLLVPFPHERGLAKVRPAVVIAVQPDGNLCLCPIRSSPRAGAACIPISIDDFDGGGLDMFLESYVQTDTVRVVKSGTVIGKKGQVTGDFLERVQQVSRR
jgi:mRNA-degrading endonuclease toxin of MazEF toxin-antitoxin module